MNSYNNKNHNNNINKNFNKTNLTKSGFDLIVIILVFNHIDVMFYVNIPTFQLKFDDYLNYPKQLSKNYLRQLPKTLLDTYLRQIS